MAWAALVAAASAAAAAAAAATAGLSLLLDISGIGKGGGGSGIKEKGGAAFMVRPINAKCGSWDTHTHTHMRELFFFVRL